MMGSRVTDWRAVVQMEISDMLKRQLEATSRMVMIQSLYHLARDSHAQRGCSDRLERYVDLTMTGII